MSEKKQVQKAIIAMSLLQSFEIIALKDALEKSDLNPEIVQAFEPGAEVALLTTKDGTPIVLDKDVFNALFPKGFETITQAEEKQLEKTKDIFDQLKIVAKVNGFIEKVKRKEFSIKHLGNEILKVYKVDLDKINNDEVNY